MTRSSAPRHCKGESIAGRYAAHLTHSRSVPPSFTFGTYSKSTNIRVPAKMMIRSPFVRWVA